MGEAEASLHVFCDDIEWYVASSVEEAKRFQREFSGCGKEDQDSAEWNQWPNGAELRVWLDPENMEVSTPCAGAILVIGDCSVWAEAFGPGFLCSTEY